MMPGFYTNVAALAGGGSSPPASGVTWDATNKNANVTLSADKLTATASTAATADSPGLAALAITSGQSIYTEVLCVSLSGTSEPGIGFGNSSTSFSAGDYLGINADSVCLFQSGSVWTNNGSIAHVHLFAAGDTLRVAVKKIDSTTLHVWYATNDGNWNDSATADPATDTEGISVTISGDAYLAYNVDYASSTATSFTLVQPGSYSFTAPTGFGGYGA